MSAEKATAQDGSLFETRVPLLRRCGIRGEISFTMIDVTRVGRDGRYTHVGAICLAVGQIGVGGICNSNRGGQVSIGVRCRY